MIKCLGIMYRNSLSGEINWIRENSTDCRQRRNGSTHAGRGLLVNRMAPSKRLRGTKKIQVFNHILLARKTQTHGDYTICWATWMSGVRMDSNSIRQLLFQIPQDHHQAMHELYAVVTCMVMPVTVVRLIANSTILSFIPETWASD